MTTLYQTLITLQNDTALKVDQEITLRNKNRVHESILSEYRLDQKTLEYIVCAYYQSITLHQVSDSHLVIEVKEDETRHYLYSVLINRGNIIAVHCDLKHRDNAWRNNPTPINFDVISTEQLALKAQRVRTLSESFVDELNNERFKGKNGSSVTGNKPGAIRFKANMHRMFGNRNMTEANAIRCLLLCFIVGRFNNQPVDGVRGLKRDIFKLTRILNCICNSFQ